MMEAVFLDLDNTLFLFDEAAFYANYFIRIKPFFADLIPPEQFQERLRRSLRALVQNDGRVPNSLCFLDTFCFRYRARLPAVWQRFLFFYESEYDQIPVRGQAAPGLKAVISDLSRRGLRLVVASNPVFPLIAQQKRLAWAGLESKQFELMTHLENMSHVKPNPGYFQEIYEILQVSPERCLMVGNDPVNDMAAGCAGLRTYLTTDARNGNYRWSSVAADNQDSLVQPDFYGPLADLPKALDQLMA
jgi:FMN phosphatase YigB (HAD superfamily)